MCHNCGPDPDISYRHFTCDSICVQDITWYKMSAFHSRVWSWTCTECCYSKCKRPCAPPHTFCAEKRLINLVKFRFRFARFRKISTNFLTRLGMPLWRMSDIHQLPLCSHWVAALTAKVTLPHLLWLGFLLDAASPYRSKYSVDGLLRLSI